MNCFVECGKVHFKAHYIIRGLKFFAIFAFHLKFYGQKKIARSFIELLWRIFICKKHIKECFKILELFI